MHKILAMTYIIYYDIKIFLFSFEADNYLLIVDGAVIYLHYIGREKTLLQ